MNKAILYTLFIFLFFIFISCSNFFNENYPINTPDSPTLTALTANGDSDNFYTSLSIESKCNWHKVSVYRAFIDIQTSAKDSDFIKIVDKKEYDSNLGFNIEDKNVSITIGKKYVYRAKAEYMGEESEFSEIKELLFYTPSAPTNVKAVVASSNSVKISWNSVNGAEYYKIYESANGCIGDTTSTSFESAANITPEKYYTVTAYFCNGTYSSEPSSPAYIKPDSPTLTSLIANGDSDNFYITLSIDTKSSLQKVSVYRAKAEYMGEESEFSEIKELSFYTPTAPTNVKAVATSSNSVKISWDSVNGAEYYKIFKDGIELVDTNITTTSFENTNASINSKTYYTVKAYFCNGIYSSEFSSPAYIQIDKLEVPTLTSLVANIDSSSLYITFSVDTKFNLYAVSIYRALIDIESSANDSDFVKIIDKKEYDSYRGYNIEDKDVSISIGKKYVYKAKAEYMGEESEFSEIKEIPFYTPSAPTNVKAVATSSNSVKISWDSVNGAGYYKIYDSTNSCIGDTTSTSFENTNVSMSSKTYYTVKAYFFNGAYSSEQSSPAYIPICKISFESSMQPDTMPDSIYIEKNTSITSSELPQISFNRYEFLGWYLKDNEETYADGLILKDDITLIAKWQIVDPAFTGSTFENLNLDLYGWHKNNGATDNDAKKWATQKNISINITSEKSPYFDYYEVSYYDEVNGDGKTEKITGNSIIFDELHKGRTYPITVKEFDKFGQSSNAVTMNF